MSALGIFSLKTSAILMRVVVVLFSFSLMTSEVEHLSYVHWLSDSLFVKLYVKDSGHSPIGLSLFLIHFGGIMDSGHWTLVG